MFYIQHGYGKSDKIEDVSDVGFVSGVILSPGHESPTTLRETVRRCELLGLRTMLDPQAYIYSTRPAGELRHHADHGLELDQMSWAMTPGELSGTIDSVAAANRTAGVAQPWLSPSPFHRSLTDYWMPAALQFARTAAQNWSGRVIASVAVDEPVFADWSRVSEWLDVLTTLDIDGFYLVVSRRNVQFPPAAWDPATLSNVLRFIHVLAALNEYDVTWGYSDVDGLLGLAAGATGVASGWSYGLRQFNIDKYSETRTGGAAPVPRLLMRSLIADVRAVEVEDIAQRFGRESPVFSEDLLERFDTRSFDSVGNPEAQAQHLVTLSAMSHEIAQHASLLDRIELLESWLRHAVENHESLARTGLVLEPKYVARLRSYLDSLSAFRGSVSL